MEDNEKNLSDMYINDTRVLREEIEKLRRENDSLKKKKHGPEMNRRRRHV